MKSKRRHELQQNTLDVELGKIIGWLRRHGTKLAVAALIIAVMALGVTLYRRSSQTAIAEAQVRYENLRSQSLSPDSKPEDVISGFIELSNQNDVPWIAAASLVEAGNINLAQMTLAETAQARKGYGDQAAGFYQQVLYDWQDQPAAVGAALVGLARVAETRGEFDIARQRYEQVTDNADLAGYPIADIARMSLGELDSMEEPVRLASHLPDWVDPLPEAGQTPSPDSDEPVSTDTDAPERSQPADAESDAARTDE
ncbi:MAG: hypothetical protein GVY16_00925 [Planctomycetes bacterium]|nr:hypothetical protein [Planctomycetota bacterium]